MFIKKVHDVFVEKFAKAVQAIKVGNGMEAGIHQGPLIDQAAFEKVERHIADALKQRCQADYRWQTISFRRHLLRAHRSR
jgi:acyl-CoA reductase-like NAD-dependent aldehyde dehydrogenase